MHVVIFEGIRWDSFIPLSLSKPTFMLPCGMGTLLDKQIELLQPTRLTLWVRPELAEFCRNYVLPALKIPAAVNQPLDAQPALITTGRTLHLAKFEIPEGPAAVIEEGDLVRFAHVTDMAGLSHEDVLSRSERWLTLLELPRTIPQARYIDHVWDLVSWNEEALVADFVRFRGTSQKLNDGPWHLTGERENIVVAPGAKLGPGCVLDASRGPVVVDAGATIGANAVLEGPCYIGQYSYVRPVSLIRSGTTIGAMCRVGGEISNSIISPYSNKAHDGYLGDSIVGSWVNLGAATTTSNLKNTYGEVTLQIGGRKVQTGRRRLGSIIGDHTKTAIGTRLNTGSYIGACCQLAGSGLAPKFVPSFSFWTDQGMQKYQLDKAIEVARRAMERRDRPLGSTDEAILRYIEQIAPQVER
ncbi:putative sugar nucleotidyl transferase [Fontivita pretiosa]|uniref:putative sugar nucleotidyl transferase n=1 Tax=Fontivita pretiosa TaxID=2989684 RepID=UPI003D1837F7